MGLIKSAIAAVGGSLGDQWLEVFEPANMGEGIVFSKGVRLREREGRKDRRDKNVKGTSDAISNGSLIHVYEGQAALLVDGGAIVDFAAEPGVFEVDNSSLPSIFSGGLGESVKESFNRFRFGGANPTKQQVFYINLQEIKGIKFGTRNALQYFDNFYNAELFLRCHGNYSIKIVDPILFYKEAIPKNEDQVHVDDINEQYLSEFLEALQVSINQMSVDGVRISQVTSKMGELSNYMKDALDDEWRDMRGIEVQAVGISSISYDDESKELINMRNRGAMLGDPGVREGYVQGAIARGLEAAGSNEAGAGQTFMGLGLGMQAGGNYMGQASQANLYQMQMQGGQQPASPVAGANVPAGAQPVANPNAWACPECNTGNSGNFCTQCGTAKPAPVAAGFCSNCGHKFEGGVPKFCPNCGTQQ